MTRNCDVDVTQMARPNKGVTSHAKCNLGYMYFYLALNILPLVTATSCQEVEGNLFFVWENSFNK